MLSDIVKAEKPNEIFQSTNTIDFETVSSIRDIHKWIAQS